MAARESAEVRAACEAVIKGMSTPKAAKQYGVALSSVTRGLRRRNVEPIKPGGERVVRPAEPVI
jgi:transposase